MLSHLMIDDDRGGTAKRRTRDGDFGPGSARVKLAIAEPGCRPETVGKYGCSSVKDLEEAIAGSVSLRQWQSFIAGRRFFDHAIFATHFYERPCIELRAGHPSL
jgi:hypothetical protein